ncbi:glycosyltransferase family 2 protein [Salimicrobium jeotgali]|uniref:glycosyltransferase family 2 protein n=1 Tax=Salimicrobium jeotgali TaxID=1230341 RepID=UPI001471E4D8|nr:glycosyltransferase family A protein [Salimicrobium jeotgali]
MKLSIIVPHFNSSGSLERLLASIPARHSLEVIVVDDHSAPDEKAKLEVLRDKFYKHRLSFFTNAADKKSAGAARNEGLYYASGQWVLFADADDYFLDGFYEKVSAFFESAYDIVYFTPISVYNGTDEQADRHVKYEVLVKNYLKEKNRLAELKLRYQFEVPWSKLFRRSLIMRNYIKFDELMYANDVLFSVKTGYYAQEIYASDEQIYCATKDSGSLTTVVTEKSFDTRCHVFLREHYFLKDHLSKAEFEIIEPNGRYYLLGARKFGIRKVWKVYRALRKQKVKILTRRMLNPWWFKDRYRKVKKEETELERFKDFK